MVVPDQDKIDKVKQYLRGYPRGLTITDLASKMHVNRNLIANYLDMLLVSGQVEVRVVGPTKVYTLSHRVPISAMLEFSSDYIIVTDAEQRIIQVNEPLLQFLKAHRNALIGKTTSEMEVPFINSLPLPEPIKNRNPSNMTTTEISSVQDGKTFHFRVKPVPAVFEDGKQGITYLIEDITETKEAAEEISRHNKRMEFFSKILQEFIELPPESNIYEKIGNDLASLIPGTMIAVNSIDNPTMIITLQHVTGIEGCRSIISQYLNRDPIGLELPINAEGLAAFRLGKLASASLSNNTLSYNTFPEALYEKIVREFDLGDTVYAIGFVRNGTLYGQTGFFPQKGRIIADPRLVEAYGQAASIALQRHMAEKALKKSEQLYRGLAEKIRGAFYRTDCEGNLIMASSSWAGILGYDSVDECIGRNIADTWYMVPGQRKVFLDTIHKDGAVRNYEVLLKRKDGTPQLVEVTSQLYYDEKGAVLGVEGFFREIPGPQGDGT